MMKQKRSFSLGYSPCPNDTFIFFALAEKRIDTMPHDFDILLADVEELNQKARAKQLDITKVSMHAMLNLLDDYWMLRTGGAMGRGCGPLIVSREPTTVEELRNRRLAIPGRMTTANLLLKMMRIHDGPCVEMRFDLIMPAILRGEVDGGVIIHEGRFTYASMGLHLVVDCGAWWEEQTGLPLPLGGIVVRRHLGPDVARFVEEKIRESILYSRTRPEQAWPYIRHHAQEMDPSVIQQHIDMFVNDFSIHMGREGEQAIRSLLEAASRLEEVPIPKKPLFSYLTSKSEAPFKQAEGRRPRWIPS